MVPYIGNSWQDFFDEECRKEYYQQLTDRVTKERQKYSIYPPQDKTFRAFELVPFDKVKVVILGQDPYHGAGQANGLAFSTDSEKIPPSLRNIYTEIYEDIGIAPRDNLGDLTPWAQEGVFLLNSTLTVRAGQANSHKDLWWDVFTDSAIKALAEDSRPKVFLLWGNFARKKKSLIMNKTHLVLEAAHPSPLSASRGFFGCRHFSKTNEFLESVGQTPIDW